MDNSLGVRRIQRVGNLNRQLQRFVERQLAGRRAPYESRILKNQKWSRRFNEQDLIEELPCSLSLDASHHRAANRPYLSSSLSNPLRSDELHCPPEVFKLPEFGNALGLLKLSEEELWIRSGWTCVIRSECW
jgi:hypothetical protein